MMLLVIVHVCCYLLARVAGEFRVSSLPPQHPGHAGGVGVQPVGGNPGASCGLWPHLQSWAGDVSFEVSSSYGKDIYRVACEHTPTT